MSGSLKPADRHHLRRVGERSAGDRNELIDQRDRRQCHDIGATAHAAAVAGGATLTMTNGTLIANGAGANALNVTGGNATLTGVIMTSPNGASIAAPGGPSNVNLSGATAS